MNTTDVNKPVVHFVEVDDLEVGREAYVRLPNATIKKTFPVAAITPDGFETQFNRYLRVPDNPPRTT